MLNGTREHQNIAGPGLNLQVFKTSSFFLPYIADHLYRPVEELLPLVRVPGVDVRAGHDGGAPVLHGKVGDQGDDLANQMRALTVLTNKRTKANIITGRSDISIESIDQ